MIELYGMSSPNVQKVVIMLAELDLPFTFHHVNVFAEGQYDPEFLKLNPNAKVPVLVDHDTGGAPQTIFESGAILFYLAEKTGKLLPREGAARMATMQWLFLQMASVGPMLGQFNHFKLIPGPVQEYSFGRYRNEARRLYRLLDNRLGESQYLAGPDYSIADIATYPWALYIPKHDMDWADFPALKAWCDRIAARPAVLETQEIWLRIGEDTEAQMKKGRRRGFDRFFNRIPVE